MVLYKSRFIQLIIIIATVFITAIVFLQACSERKIKYVLIIDNSVVNTDSVYFQKNCFRLPLVCIDNVVIYINAGYYNKMMIIFTI